VLVEALVAEAPVEALDESVLDRLTLRNVVPSDAAFFLPVGLVPRAADFPVYQERGGATRSKFVKKRPVF